MIDEDLEPRAIEVGDPAPKVHAHGADLEERRSKTDTNAAAGDARPRHRPAQIGRGDVDRARDERRVSLLQRLVVADPGTASRKLLHCQPSSTSRCGATARARLDEAFERGQPVGVRGARGSDVLGAVVEHRQRQMEPERRAKMQWIGCERTRERVARLGRLAALGEHGAQLKPFVAAGCELDRPQVELRGLVEAALALQQARKPDERAAQIGPQPQRRPQRSLGGASSPRSRSSTPASRGRTRSRAAARAPCGSRRPPRRAPSLAQRRSEVVPGAHVVGLQRDRLPQARNGALVVAGVGKQETQIGVGFRIVGPQPDRRAQAGDRGGELPGILLRLRQSKLQCRIGRRRRRRRLRERERVVSHRRGRRSRPRRGSVRGAPRHRPLEVARVPAMSVSGDASRPRADRRATVGHERGVVGKAHGDVDIFAAAVRDGLGDAEIREDRVRSPLAVPAADERHDRHAHVERLERPVDAAVGHRVEHEVDDRVAGLVLRVVAALRQEQQALGGNSARPRRAAGRAHERRG